MAIREKERAGAVVLKPDSDITWKNQPELKRVLDQLSANGQKHIIIDLSHVREISGYGLGLLASRCGRLRRDHGDIRLANASDPIKRVLQVTALDDLFEQFDSADNAVRSFSIIDRGVDQSEEDEEE